MTIMKAIAMAALAGTLLAGPGAAISQTTEHGNSASAHMNNDTRKAARQADLQGDTGGLRGHGRGKALGQPNFGTVVSSLHRNGGASSTLDLTKLSDSYTINEVDLSSYSGARMHAIDNALKNVSSTDIQTQLSADAELTAAIEAQLGTTDLSSVSYAYVDASGNLVVFTR